MSTAEILIASVIKSIGKRQFLKEAEKVSLTAGKSNANANGNANANPRVKLPVPAEIQCIARKKGDKTGIKAGKHVLYDSIRCPRKESSDTHLCVVHTNTVARKGSLLYGVHSEPLTEDCKKVFGEL